MMLKTVKVHDNLLLLSLKNTQHPCRPPHCHSTPERRYWPLTSYPPPCTLCVDMLVCIFVYMWVQERRVKKRVCICWVAEGEVRRVWSLTVGEEEEPGTKPEWFLSQNSFWYIPKEYISNKCVALFWFLRTFEENRHCLLIIKPLTKRGQDFHRWATTWFMHHVWIPMPTMNSLAFLQVIHLG